MNRGAAHLCFAMNLGHAKNEFCNMTCVDFDQNMNKLCR